MALVLTRRVGEEITIGPDIVVRVVLVDRGRVQLSITAPQSVMIDRPERHRRTPLPPDGPLDRFDSGLE